MFRSLLRRFLWNVSILFSCVLVSVHNSLLYKKTLDMYALKSRSLTFSLIFLLVRISLYWMKAGLASCFLLFMSSSVSNKVPRYLHFFHSSPPFLLMWCSSVLFLFTCRFLDLSLSGIVLLIWSVLCLAFEIHPMSSAYCWLMRMEVSRLMASIVVIYQMWWQDVFWWHVLLAVCVIGAQNIWILVIFPELLQGIGWITQGLGSLPVVLQCW